MTTEAKMVLKEVNLQSDGTPARPLDYSIRHALQIIDGRHLYCVSGGALLIPGDGAMDEIAERLKTELLPGGLPNEIADLLARLAEDENSRPWNLEIAHELCSRQL